MLSAKQASPHQPAVDRGHRAGYVVGEIVRQELDHPGAILNRPEPAEGDQFGLILVSLNASRNHRRPDPPRGDHAGRNAVRRDPKWAEVRYGVRADSGFAAPNGHTRKGVIRRSLRPRPRRWSSSTATLHHLQSRPSWCHGPEQVIAVMSCRSAGSTLLTWVSRPIPAGGSIDKELRNAN
jgi:hypothetical protein